MDGLELDWISPNEASANNVPKILHRAPKKGTILQLATNMFLIQILEDSIGITHVPTQGNTVYHNIIITPEQSGQGGRKKISS